MDEPLKAGERLSVFDGLMLGLFTNTLLNATWKNKFHGSELD
jgi:hypothetical protein